MFRIRVFTVERPDPHSATGRTPAVQGVVYAVAADEGAALAYTAAHLPTGLQGGDLGVLEEIATDLPLWTVRVGQPEPGRKGRRFRAAAMSWYRLVGARDRESVPEVLRTLYADDAHRMRMVGMGWVEVSEEPLRLDREAIL